MRHEANATRALQYPRDRSGCEKQLKCFLHCGAGDAPALRRRGKREADFPGLAVARQVKTDVANQSVRVGIGNA
jgi:hypothetical protein